MSFQEHPSPPKPVLTVPEQIEWCYREHIPGQIQWLKYSPLSPRRYRKRRAA